MVVVPLYDTLGPDAIRFIINTGKTNRQPHILYTEQLNTEAKKPAAEWLNFLQMYSYILKQQIILVWLTPAAIFSRGIWEHHCQLRRNTECYFQAKSLFKSEVENSIIINYAFLFTTSEWDCLKQKWTELVTHEMKTHNQRLWIFEQNRTELKTSMNQDF